MSSDLDIPLERAPDTYRPSRSALAKVRAASAALGGGGITSLAYGIHVVAASHWFVSGVVPVFLGLVGGGFAWIEARLIKQRLGGGSDTAEWLRAGVTWMVAIIMLSRVISARLQPGVGYLMAGVALVVAAIGLYQTFVISSED